MIAWERRGVEFAEARGCDPQKQGEEKISQNRKTGTLFTHEVIISYSQTFVLAKDRHSQDKVLTVTVSVSKIEERDA